MKKLTGSAVASSVALMFLGGAAAAPAPLTATPAPQVAQQLPTNLVPTICGRLVPDTICGRLVPDTICGRVVADTLCAYMTTGNDTE